MTTNADIEALLTEYRRLKDEKEAAESIIRNAKAGMGAIENQLKDHMITVGMNSVGINGLFSVSLTHKTRYADNGGFIRWALEHDTDCLTISMKQSGVAALEERGGLPPMVVKTPYVDITLRTKK